MSISNLIKSIKIGLRSKLFVCALTIIAGYSYCFIDNPLARLLSILVFAVSAEAMIVLWGNFFFGNLFEGLKMLFKSENSVSWVDIPEFKKLAKQMGIQLHKKQPFGIKKGLNNAYASYLTNQIILGEELLKKLRKKERLALASHEFTHLKGNHPIKMFYGLLIVFLLTSLSLSLATPPTIVSNLIYAAIFVITFVFISRLTEYTADAGAAKQIGKEPTISLLRKLVPSEQWDRESETHPSIRDRISKLQKM